MNSQKRWEGLYTQAHRAYDQGHNKEAALYWEQARQAAEEQGNLAAAFSSGVWAGVSWVMAGKPLRAQELFVTQLTRIPQDVDPVYVWIARTQALETSLDFQPNLSDLQRLLHDLQTRVGQEACANQSDLLWLQNRMHAAQGLHRQAVSDLEQAWCHPSKSQGVFMKFLLPYDAASSLLALGNPTEADHWVTCLGKTDSAYPESRVSWYDLQARLALYRNNLPAFDDAMAHLTDGIVGLQRPTWQRTVLLLQVRHALLTCAAADPLHRDHPARRALAKRIRGVCKRHELYDRRLLVLDYRLAALRFALGIPPVDDLFYTSPQTHLPCEVRSTANAADFRRRVAFVRRGLHAASAAARLLDACFACDWRQREVQQREARLQELLEAHGEACSLSSKLSETKTV